MQHTFSDLIWFILSIRVTSKSMGSLNRFEPMISSRYSNIPSSCSDGALGFIIEISSTSPCRNIANRSEKWVIYTNSATIATKLEKVLVQRVLIREYRSGAGVPGWITLGPSADQVGQRAPAISVCFLHNNQVLLPASDVGGCINKSKIILRSIIIPSIKPSTNNYQYNKNCLTFDCMLFLFTWDVHTCNSDF